MAPDDAAMAGIREACARHGTAFAGGYVERSGRARPFNSMIVIGPDGRVAGSYRKTHLFGEESTAFEPGDELACVDVAGLTLAPMICFDIEIPEVARTLAREAPDLMVAVAANMAPYDEDHLVASRARALDNRTPLVYVNRVGREAGLTFVGGSRVVAPDGRVEVDLGDGERVVAVEVELRAPLDPATDYLRQLRPELYR
jgi:predicted amidohydrolase